MLGLSYRLSLKANASGVFQCTDITGLQLWFRRQSFITHDTDGVSKWEDISGNNNDATQSDNAKKPRYSGALTVDFEGHNTLTLGSQINLGAFTIIMAIDPAETATLSNEAPLGKGGNDQIKMYRGAANNRIALKANGVQSDINPMGTTFPTSQFLLTCVREAGGRFKVRINKSEVGAVVTDVTDLFDITQIGSGDITTTEFNGAINEIAVWDREINSTDLSNAENNISDRNGI
tara:strand:- start:10406 stop:11107 length:702 start_codon:yes stop_codon:yes gene_type:complete